MIPITFELQMVWGADFNGYEVGHPSSDAIGHFTAPIEVNGEEGELNAYVDSATGKVVEHWVSFENE